MTQDVGNKEILEVCGVGQNLDAMFVCSSSKDSIAQMQVCGDNYLVIHLVV